jgi:hypothetical protein
VGRVNARRLELLLPAYVDAREYAIACVVWSALNPAGLARDSLPPPNECISDEELSAAFNRDVQGCS